MNIGAKLLVSTFCISTVKVDNSEFNDSKMLKLVICIDEDTMINVGPN